MKRRKWKSMTAWMLIAVLCAGNVASASGINDTDTAAAAAMDTTDGSDTAETIAAVMNETNAAAEETASTEGETTPAEEETASTEGETTPAEEETASTEGETTPAEGEAAPVEGETDPMEDETAPVASESGEDIYGDAAPEANGNGQKEDGTAALPEQASESDPAMDPVYDAEEEQRTEEDTAESASVMRNADYVLPDSATLVYGEKLDDAVLNGASGDGTFYFYEYNDSIKTFADTIEYLADNIAPEKTGESDRYGIWFRPADGTDGSGQRITVTVLPKPVTIVINDVTATYGDTPAGYTYDETDAMNQKEFEDTLADFAITLSARDQDGNEITEKTPAGTYAITGTSASEKYDVTFQTGKLTIEPKEAELSWSGYEDRTYDPDGNANVTASVSNLVNGDTCNVTVENGSNRNAGEYTAVATALDNVNYKLPENAAKEYIIEKATPDCEAVTAALTYGQTLAEAEMEGAASDPTNKSPVSGSFAFDDGNVLPVVADSGTTTYPVTFYPEDAVNYNEVSIPDYQLTVSRKPLTVQMLSREKIYGDELSPDVFVSYDKSELVGTDGLKIIPTAADGNGAAQKLDPTYINAGTYTISADQKTLDADNPNYAVTVQDGSLKVEKRPVVLQWSEVSNIVYQYVDGKEDADKWAVTGANVSASVANLVKQADGTLDDCRVVVEGGTETEPSRGEAENAELTVYYAAVVGLVGTASGNYTFSEELPGKPWDIAGAYQSSRLKPYVIRGSEDCIFPAVMIMTYGESFQDVRMFAGSGNGTFEIVDQDHQSLADQKPDAGTYQDTYMVKFTPADGSEPSYGTGTLIVRKIPLTVTAENAWKTYGSGKPDYTWTVTGGELVNGDNLKELLTVKSVIRDGENSAMAGEISGDEKTSGVNVYEIVLDEQLNGNYDLTFMGAKLVITPKEIEIVWSDTSNIIYGYADGKKDPETWRRVGANVTASAGGLVNDDVCNLIYSGGNGTDAGEYLASVTGLDNPNYCLPSSGRTRRYEILKADPEAVFPEELNADKGSKLGDLSFEAGAAVSGTFTFEAADTVLEKSGTYKMIFTPDDAQNYHGAEAMVKVTVSERKDDGNGGSGDDETGDSGEDETDSSGDDGTGKSGSGGTDSSGSKGTGSAAEAKAKGAETSDNSPLLPYSLLALLSFSVIIMMVLKKKRC